MTPQPRIGKPVQSVHVASIRRSDGSVEMAKAVRLDDLRLPIHIALGRYEAATQEELNDLISDLTAERDRREATRAA